MKARMPCALLTLVVGMGALHPGLAVAAFIPTDELLAQSASAPFRASAVLAREDVRERLIALGVEPAVIQARLDALTPEESNQLAERLDTLPAGGDAVGAVIFIFMVLLITDVLGYTDVYPFITRTVNGDKHDECADRVRHADDALHSAL